VFIDLGTETFPDLIKRIRAETDKEVIGNKIASIKQAKNGGAITQVRGGQDAVQVVRN